MTLYYSFHFAVRNSREMRFGCIVTRWRRNGHLHVYGRPGGSNGSGANSGRQGVRLGSAWLSELRWAQAASAAFHNSDIVAFRPPSLPVLNCPFLIFSANSIPEIVTAASSNRLNPSMDRIRCFTLRWSCSTRLFKYWLERTFTRRGSSPLCFISRTARCEAA